MRFTPHVPGNEVVEHAPFAAHPLDRRAGRSKSMRGHDRASNQVLMVIVRSCRSVLRKIAQRDLRRPFGAFP
jgi:hypothetical protein